MNSLVFSLSVLSLMSLVHTIPCYDSGCAGYNNMGLPSFGYENANFLNVVNGGGYEVQEESNGGDEYNGGGGSSAYIGVFGGAGSEGDGDSGYQGVGGGGYNQGGASGYQKGGGGGHNGGGGSGYQKGGGTRPPRRNNYCPNCYVQDFGNGGHNANTINIKHRRN